MRAAIYTRCSADHQSIDAGIASCRAEVARRGWDLAAQFDDFAISGAVDSRPGLDAMLALVKSNGVGALVVPALDRLARSAAALLQIEKTLRRHGVALVSLRESIDSTTPTGRAMLQMLAVWSEFERELIRTRTREALAHKRRALQPGARAIADDEVHALKRAEPGLSIREMASRLGASRSTVHRALRAQT